MNKFWLLSLVVGLACLQACRQDLELPRLPTNKLSDEEQIAVVLNDVHRGLERKRIYMVLAHISHYYQDEEGRDYEAIRDLLTDRMRLYREVRITRMRPRISVQGDHAQVIETLGASAQPFNPVNTPPIDLQGNVTVFLERMAHTWQITGYRTSH